VNTCGSVSVLIASINADSRSKLILISFIISIVNQKELLTALSTSNHPV
jgi:hypothetical protein